MKGIAALIPVAALWLAAPTAADPAPPPIPFGGAPGIGQAPGLGAPGLGGGAGGGDVGGSNAVAGARPGGGH